jgi:uncharacterized damage-inducible protein DinB
MLDNLDATWNDLQTAIAELTDAGMQEPGVTGAWSVKDILAHVTTWEEEPLADLRS